MIGTRMIFEKINEQSPRRTRRAAILRLRNDVRGNMCGRRRHCVVLSTGINWHCNNRVLGLQSQRRTLAL